MHEQLVSLSPTLRLAYIEQGAPDGAPVVFLHGVTDSCRAFGRVLDLLPRRFRAFAISQRGHGDSTRPDTGYTYRDMSEDLCAFMDALSLPSAVVVGHSMGSMVAQRFAVDHPDRVAGLVLMGAFATMFQRPGFSEFVETSILPLADPIDPGFARDWQLSTVARAIDPVFLDTVVKETQKVPARVWRAALEGFLNTPDFSADLAGLSMPALLMWGDGGAYASFEDQRRLMEVMPGARFITYEGAGHAFHWEDPPKFVSDLLGFLAIPRTQRGNVTFTTAR